MRNWRVIINCNDVIFEIEIEAESYSDAFIRSENNYPSCAVKSITEIREPLKNDTDLSQNPDGF
jgi:hypothetical protein